MKTRRILLAIFGAGFAASAIFHFVAAAQGGAGEPIWRHLLFGGINVFVAAMMSLRRRPKWFVWAFGVLFAQQMYSHGLDAWRAWEAGRLDWRSLVVLATMPPALALLMVESCGSRPRCDLDPAESLTQVDEKPTAD